MFATGVIKACISNVCVGVVHIGGSTLGNTGGSDVIPDARTLFGPFPSPNSLDLNRRASLREFGSTNSGIGKLPTGQNFSEFVRTSCIQFQVITNYLRGRGCHCLLCRCG